MRSGWLRLEWRSTSTNTTDMGIMDFIKGELLEVIEFMDDSRDTLSWRFPDEDKAIKNGAQLIVRESQMAQFVYLGQYGDSFGPGKHTLVTDNIPVLSRLKGWKYGFESPFKADVYYVTTRLFTGNKWGTANPIMMRDKDFGVVRLPRVRDFRFQDRQRPGFPQGSGGHRSSFPVGRVRGHDALADRKHVQRRACILRRACAGCGLALHRVGRRAAAADQSAGDREIRDRGFPRSSWKTSPCRRK